MASSDPDPGPGPDSDSSFDLDSYDNYPLADVQHNFNDSREVEHLQGEADDEEEDEGSNGSSIGSVRSRKAGQRYTELDFFFLEEKWLLPMGGSDDSTSSGTD